MNLGDSIAALASPPGRSLRAVIRLSGPGVDDALAALLEHPPTMRIAAPARLRLSPNLTLPILLLYFPAPASYTGETAAELLFPGNPFLIERILALLTAQPGLRPAEPGEFSARAYLNGRLTVDQAEGVAAIVAAETADQVNAARDLLTGRTGSAYRAWADELTTLLALVEAGIDFTDQEDVQPIAPADLHRRLAAMLTSIDHHLGAAAGRSTIDTLPTVALLGPPNAGKSTLFNALLGRRRAVTSPAAGTTRDALAEPLDLSHDLPGASMVMLIDLAGLDDTADPHAGDERAPRGRSEIAGSPSPRAADRAMTGSSPSAPFRGAEEVAGPQSGPDGGGPSRRMSVDVEAQSRAHATAARADLILHCDPTGRFDQRPLHFLPPGRPILSIRTKADLPSLGDSAPDPRSPEPPIPDPLPICALDGWNLPLLRRLIAQRTTSARGAGIAGLLPRHRLALLHLRDHLSAADELTCADQARLSAPELTAAALREGLDALGELVGRISPDEVLGRIFASFCVGK